MRASLSSVSAARALLQERGSTPHWHRLQHTLCAWLIRRFDGDGMYKVDSRDAVLLLSPRNELTSATHEYHMVKEEAMRKVAMAERRSQLDTQVA